MKSTLNVTTKLQLSFATSMAICGVALSLALWNIRTMNGQFNEAVSKTARELQLASALKEGTFQVAATQRGTQ